MDRGPGQSVDRSVMAVSRISWTKRILAGLRGSRASPPSAPRDTVMGAATPADHRWEPQDHQAGIEPESIVHDPWLDGVKTDADTAPSANAAIMEHDGARHPAAGLDGTPEFPSQEQTRECAVEFMASPEGVVGARSALTEVPDDLIDRRSPDSPSSHIADHGKTPNSRLPGLWPGADIPETALIAAGPASIPHNELDGAPPILLPHVSPTKESYKSGDERDVKLGDEASTESDDGQEEDGDEVGEEDAAATSRPDVEYLEADFDGKYLLETDFDATDNDPLSLPDESMDESAIDSLIAEFDSSARQGLWDVKSPEANDRKPRLARQKAAEITMLIDAPTLGERTTLLAWLEVLFRQLPSPATYRAIKSSVMTGVNGDTLKSMVDLRQEWAGRWGQVARRSLATGAFGGSNQAEMLTWKLARRICEARPEYPPEAMIDDAWFDEWQRLPRGHTFYQSFSSLVLARVRDPKALQLCEGLGKV